MAQVATCSAEAGYVHPLLNGLSRRNADTTWPDHSAFGHTTHRAWGPTVKRGTDYHLRRFED